MLQSIGTAQAARQAVDAGAASTTAGTSGSTPRADITGDVEAMSLWAGQSVGLVKKVQPAAEIVREINDGAQAILRRLAAA